MLTVVVGHGRSTEGQGWGPLIDSADRVVRMWNWHWCDMKDYGTRYDWGLIEIHPCLTQWKQHNKCQPSQGWVASLLMEDRDYRFPDNTSIIDQCEFLNSIPEQFQGCGETGTWQLTRGGVAACWAISTAQEGDSLILVGFDVIKDGVAMAVDEAFSPEYMASEGFFGISTFKEGATKEGNHDYPAERYLIETMGKCAGVAVVFAEDEWPLNIKRVPKQKFIKRILTGDNESMKFRYIGVYPAGQQEITAYGCKFTPFTEVEVPEQWLEKFTGNRFFELVVDYELVPVEPEPEEEPRNRLLDAMPSDKDDLIALAGERGVKIDKRWNADKIAAAIVDAENGE
jgi:hypothetical protein